MKMWCRVKGGYGDLQFEVHLAST
uniref:Uncharacterized protein n=1 Tax=Arundo donax TaxID=35708 RepID=A0A0A9FG74_ARUDO